jgi:hypothetical protein
LWIAAAVGTAGFWTYQFIWSAPQPLLAVTSDSTPEAEQQRLAAIKEEEQRQAKTADLEAKLTSAEAEQQRLKEEVQHAFGDVRARAGSPVLNYQDASADALSCALPTGG